MLIQLCFVTQMYLSFFHSIYSQTASIYFSTSWKVTSPVVEGIKLCELRIGNCYLTPHRLNHEPQQLLTLKPSEKSSGWRSEKTGSVLQKNWQNSLQISQIFSREDFVSPMIASPCIQKSTKSSMVISAPHDQQ